MNRKQLLALARANGFEGGNLAEIKAWMTENGIEKITAPDGKSVDVDEAWGTKAVLTLDEGESLNSLEVVGAEPSEEEMAEQERAAAEEQIQGRSASRTNLRTRQMGTEVGKAYAGVESPAVRTKRGRACAKYDQAVKSGGLVYVPGMGKMKPAFSSSEAAEFFGAKMRLHVTGNGQVADYPELENDRTIVKTLVTNNNLLGGGLVPDDYSADLIELKEEYGAARRLIGVTPMSRDSMTVPRALGDVAPTWQTEAGTETAQNKPESDTVELVAKKLMGLTQISAELLNDSAISVADFWGRSWARGVGNKEDLAAFLGDGTSTYGGIEGFNNQIADGSGTGPGEYQSAGGDFASITLAEFSNLLALLPGYVHVGGNIKWGCHSRFFFEVMDRLMRAAGGNTQSDLGNSSGRQFLGYPVEFVQSQHSTDPGQDIVFCTVGDHSAGAKFGEVRGSNEVATSDQRYFEQDLIAIRGKERVAINIHGDGVSTTADPVVGMSLTS